MRIASIILLTILLMGCYSREPEKTGKEGQPIPDFKLMHSDTVTHFWSKDIKDDNPTVFVYFGTHCPYSRAEIQEIVDNIDDLSDIRFYLITPESLKDMAKYTESYHLYGMDNLMVGQDCESFFEKHFDANVVPYNFIYGKDHRLKAVFPGQVGVAEIKKYARD